MFELVMALEEYKQKRKFDKTPEPIRGTGTESELRFVVQKHAASHLHYDFRLELKGVLKSWAVPKGPSLNLDEHRLAMQTEDHPIDYLRFEGIIPKGQYGGGTVIVWDEGTYETFEIEEKDKKAQEHSIMSQFWKGGILFTLHGQKIKGKFAIIKHPERDEKSWYLLKVEDEFVSDDDITANDKSVISGLSIEEMKASPEAEEWQSNRAAKQETKETTSLDKELLHRGAKAEMPVKVNPMNATLRSF
jgi:bifunctional non-homologous end joining protein LigD